LRKKAKFTFKRLIYSLGCAEKAAEALWKWCDFSEKKGVASF
jgi:hypothetical protein